MVTGIGTVLPGEELARRVSSLELADDPVYRPNLLIRGLRELPLRVRA